METKVLFNGTISFRDREAAARFLDRVGEVVTKSVAVFHNNAGSSPAALAADLREVQGLLHHFVDNVDSTDDGDLELARSATENAMRAIRSLLEHLQRPLSDELRGKMAEDFKCLFEHLVVLMQLSERQQSKGFVKNINITLDTLDSVCATQRRTAFLHNQNLKSAMEVLLRGTANRAGVSPDPLLKADLEHVGTQLKAESDYFCSWVDATQHDETLSEGDKRERSRALRAALQRLRSLVEVRIASSAEFGYKYLERQRFNAAVDTLASAAKSKDKAQVIEAAREITQIVKEAQDKDLDSSQLRHDAARLIKDATAQLQGQEATMDVEAAKASMDKVAAEEQQIKGKPLMGTLPEGIQAMAAFLKSREAINAKPLKKVDGPAERYGEAKPGQAAPTREEAPNTAAPGYGLVAVMAEKRRINQ